MTPSQSSRIDTAEQAGAYLEGLINFERRPGFSYARMGLEPIRQLLDRLAHPEAGLSIVHVAGSKGKGSSCLLAEAILQAAGRRVGTFTSPHLERWSERFRIEGREVEGEALARAVERLRPHVDAMRRDRPENAPTFFDATTATALALFREAEVDHVLLEVGLGGRLDSTNAVEPAVTCITSIELEHVDKLGASLAAIAGEKAGIIKPGVPCVMGRLPLEAAEVVRKRAAELGAPLLALGVDFDVETLAEEGRARHVRYRERDGFALEFVLAVGGRPQLDNTALVLAALRRLRTLDDTRLARSARAALAVVRLPARQEVVGESPLLLIDAAHTAASTGALADELARIRARGSGRLHLVLSISSDKDPEAVLHPLLAHADCVWATRADSIRSLPAATLAEVVRALAPDLEIRAVDDPRAATRHARAALARDDVLCCAGSVYLAGIARSVLTASAEGGPGPASG